MTKTIAIVGAGLAGAKAAEAARDTDRDARIILVGDEGTAPYERPPLSKEILRGDKEPEAARVHPDRFYDDQRIELVHAHALAMDPSTRTLSLDSGRRISFDTAVLAMGAEPRRLDLAGADLAGVHHLRTVEDALRLRDAIRAAGHVAVIGAGWVGSEVAASARQMGATVTLIDPAPVPLHRVLGEQIGSLFRDLHADHGVRLRLGLGVREVRGTKNVEAVALDDGTEISADVVVVGIGVTPRVELATAAGLTVDNGVLTDEHLETSVPGIYAAGDLANVWHPHYRRHVRVEHWANALNQGSSAGRNATGRRERYERLPYFFSDQYDLGLEYVGHADPAANEVVVRGDLDARAFIAFWCLEGVVTAAMSVNVWNVVEDLKAIVTAARVTDPAQLADPDVALADLV